MMQIEDYQPLNQDHYLCVCVFVFVCVHWFAEDN